MLYTTSFFSIIELLHNTYLPCIYYATLGDSKKILLHLARDYRRSKIWTSLSQTKSKPQLQLV
jgi:hypothetical protein